MQQVNIPEEIKRHKAQLQAMAEQYISSLQEIKKHQKLSQEASDAILTFAGAIIALSKLQGIDITQEHLIKQIQKAIAEKDQIK